MFADASRCFISGAGAYSMGRIPFSDPVVDAVDIGTLANSVAREADAQAIPAIAPAIEGRVLSSGRAVDARDTKSSAISAVHEPDTRAIPVVAPAIAIEGRIPVSGLATADARDVGSLASIAARELVARSIPSVAPAIICVLAFSGIYASLARLAYGKAKHKRSSTSASQPGGPRTTEATDTQKATTSCFNPQCQSPMDSQWSRWADHSHDAEERIAPEEEWDRTDLACIGASSIGLQPDLTTSNSHFAIVRTSSAAFLADLSPAEIADLNSLRVDLGNASRGSDDIEETPPEGTPTSATTDEPDPALPFFDGTALASAIAELEKFSDTLSTTDSTGSVGDNRSLHDYAELREDRLHHGLVVAKCMNPKEEGNAALERGKSIHSGCPLSSRTRLREDSVSFNVV